MFTAFIIWYIGFAVTKGFETRDLSPREFSFFDIDTLSSFITWPYRLGYMLCEILKEIQRSNREIERVIRF